MNTPHWLKPGVYGALAGAIGLVIVGFSWGGWVTSSTADQMADGQSRTDITSTLAQICVGQSKADPALAKKLAEMKALASYKQVEFVMNTGWATMPGQDKAKREVAQMCADELSG
ncbi:MAG: hypothetical protein AB7S41_17165 [Parvibaculaceae bacterium]